MNLTEREGVNAHFYLHAAEERKERKETGAAKQCAINSNYVTRMRRRAAKTARHCWCVHIYVCVRRNEKKCAYIRRQEARSGPFLRSETHPDAVEKAAAVKQAGTRRP